MSVAIPSNQSSTSTDKSLPLAGLQLIETQSILGSTSEQQSIWYNMGSMISGIGLMTGRGIHSVELQEEPFTLASW
jgi:hypothetical protein